MGFGDWLKDNALPLGLAPFTGGLSLLPMGINAAGDALGLGGNDDAQKALVAKQQQLAQEATRRRQETQQANMNALGQSMLAFAPRNQMMAQMFGPQAAFQPSQIAQMAQNPQPLPEFDTSVGDPNSADPRVRAEQERVVAAREKQRMDNERRKQMLMGAFQPQGAGPTPLDPRQPAQARRF